MQATSSVPTAMRPPIPMPDVSARVILRALSSMRLSPAANEYELHASIAATLEGSGFLVVHEAVLAPRCRIDFLVDGVGIEVKRGRPERKRLIEQASRYLACEQLSALIVVVEKNVSLPDKICGKPVILCSLNKLWGVALP